MSKHIFLDRRPDGLSLYLYGDLQFSESDEKLYHIPLAWAPAALAARRFPGGGLRALILGGGDGLALREVLRLPEFEEVHVVDLDSCVLKLGREELAPLNRGAFADPRVRVHVRDAREFLAGARGFAVAINDFTYPRDAAGASLFAAEFFRREREAVGERGVVAVNAVSPERTPAAFACVGATLEAAGFSILPYACEIPSFAREGYGRWGFYFGSSSAITEEELSALPWPAGGPLGARDFLEGVRSLRGAVSTSGVRPNVSEELLQYLRDGKALAASAPLGVGAQGFANWLKAAEGRRSVEDLLGVLPVDRRSQTREAILEWGHQAEKLFQSADLKAFADALLLRASRLPAAWVEELKALRARLDEELPPMRELLVQAYRVFAIFMIVLLLANLFFPDNLYAKGYYGGSGGGGGDIVYSSYGGSPFHYHGFRYYGRVYDANGRGFSPAQIAFSDPKQGTQRYSSKLALTANMQLLDSGAVAYTAPVDDFKFVLEPGRLRVLTGNGKEVLVLAPPPDMDAAVRAQLSSQKDLISKAIPDHERWLEWTGWATFTDEVRNETDELAALKEISAALDSAAALWEAAPAAGTPAQALDPKWIPLFPGVYLTEEAAPGKNPDIALVEPGGALRKRPLLARAEPGDEDRFLQALVDRHKLSPGTRLTW